MVIPRIEKVEAEPGETLRLKYKGERHWREASLAGFVARFSGLASLTDPKLFGKAKVIDWGAAVGWPGELDIAASTLLRLSEEQARFSNAEFRLWQSTVRLSNNEAADALGVSLGTIKNYRTGGEIPTGIAIACRAMQRDPAVLAAHLIPRKAGRPKAA